MFGTEINKLVLLILLMGIMIIPGDRMENVCAGGSDVDSYTPGKDITMSSVQGKFKVDASYLPGAMDTRILAIKSNKTLWDVTRNKKITTKVKAVVTPENDNYEPGILVLKTNGNLYYMWKKSASSWGSKKLLSKVREFADEACQYYEGDGSVCKYRIFLVKTNGDFMKGILTTNFQGTKVKKTTWKRLLRKVKHAYVTLSDSGVPENYFALKETGVLYAWGLNKEGEVGNGKGKKVSKPYLVMRNVSKFAWANRADHGGSACYAIKKNGDLYGWGSGYVITMATSFTDSNYAKPTKLLENVSMVSGNTLNSNAIALTKDGVLWTWGRIAGDYGYYDKDGNWVQSYAFYNGIVRVADGVIAAETDGNDIFFVKKDHTLWYRGAAPGTSYKKSVKKAVKLCSNISAVKSIEYMGTFVLKTNGTLYGTNYYYKKEIGKLRKLGTGFTK